jgi:hypothetical protein
MTLYLEAFEQITLSEPGVWSLEFGRRRPSTYFTEYPYTTNWLGQADNHGFISDI